MRTTSPSFRGPVAEKCECLIPDENENCIVCGRHIEMPDLPPPDLGDIGGIIRLIDSTAQTYSQLIKDNIDPNDPSLPRLRMIGGQMMRIPHKMLYKDLLTPSYLEACRLGYRGSFERWGDIVIDATPHPPQVDSL